MTSSHRKNAHGLVNDNKILVFINYLDIATPQNVQVAFCLAHSHAHAGHKRKVVARLACLADKHAVTLQCGLYLRATLSLKMLKQKIQQRLFLRDLEVLVVAALFNNISLHFGAKLQKKERTTK
jgi:hypothetical protein